jgi:hypothetical protein
MAFDVTDAADLAALKTEVNTDPIGMGYDPTGPTATLLKLLNDPSLNKTPAPDNTASRPFDALGLMDALDPSDYDSPQAGTKAAEYTHMLLELAAYSDISTYKTKWRSQFAGNSATVTALDAQEADLSRAESLFGQGTVISRDDWTTARDS